MEKIIAEFQKSKIELLRVGLNEFNGHQLATIRVWTTRPDGDPLPTKKGVTIKVGMLPEIIAALQETEAAARKAGLLDDKAA